MQVTPAPWSIGRMDELKWFPSGEWSDTEGNTLLCKRLSPRKTTPKALIDDINKKYYSLVGWNYMHEPGYVESRWSMSHHVN